MNKALPWNGDEVDMDLRDAARRAARRDGLSLGDWLDALMEERARSLGVTADDLGAEDCLEAVTEKLTQGLDRPAHFRTTDRALATFEADRKRARVARTEAPARLAPVAASEMADFDDLARRRAALRREVAEGQKRVRDREEAAARPSMPEPRSPARRDAATDPVPQRSAIESKLNALFHALERSTERLGAKRPESVATVETDEPLAIAAAPAPVESTPARPSPSLLNSTTLSPSRTLDQAIAEIGQRQAMLVRDAEARATRPAAAAAAPVAPPAAAPLPAGAEQNAVFASLQGDIARMSSRLDAMHSDATKRAASPTAQDVAFVEIRSMLDKMRPDQSIDSLERRVQDLTAKIDDALESRVPIAAFEQLSQRIEDVHASLSDRLAATVAPAIDTGPIEAAVRDLVGSVQTLQQQSPDVAALEQLMHKLTEKLEEEREAPVDPHLFTDLQAQVGKLAERIDRSDAGLTAIVSVERSLGELFSQMEETRDAAISAAENAARTAARDTLRSAMSEGGLPFGQQRQTDAAVEQVTQDIAELRDARDAADQRLNAILGALNMTLEKVVDRLGALENEQYDHRAVAPVAPAPVPQPAPVKAAAPVASPRPAEAPVAAPAAANPLNAARRARPVAGPEPVAVAAPRRAPERPAAAAAAAAKVEPAPVAAPAAPIVDEDADFLIEPGAAPVRRATGRAPEVQPVSGPAPAGHPDPANFIAAARRAAQTAAQASAADAARTSAAATAKARGTVIPGEAGPGNMARAKSFFAARRRPLLLALAGIVMLMGAVQVARLSLAPRGTAAVADSEEAAPQAPVAQAMATAAAPTVPAESAPEAPATTAANSTAVAPTSDTTASAPVNPVKPLPSFAMGAAAVSPAAKGAVPGTLPAGLRAMAEDGSASAQYEVGLRLADGRGVARDLKGAADWFQKSAKQGLAPAAYRLGSLYEKGLGVARDPAAAMQWYQTAADQGNVRAMHNLAVMSAEGSNGKSDYAKASMWFSKAALAGVRDSQFNLAILYARGLGIEQSLPQSYTWFSIAAAQGDADAATKRDEVAGRLDAKTLAEAKKNAENFQPATNNAAANDVAAPPGGWDALSAKPTSSLKTGSKAKLSSM